MDTVRGYIPERHRAQGTSRIAILTRSHFPQHPVVSSPGRPLPLLSQSTTDSAYLQDASFDHILVNAYVPNPSSLVKRILDPLITSTRMFAVGPSPHGGDLASATQKASNSRGEERVTSDNLPVPIISIERRLRHIGPIPTRVRIRKMQGL